MRIGCWKGEEVLYEAKRREGSSLAVYCKAEGGAEEY